DASIRHDVHVVSVLGEALLRGSEPDTLAPADPEIVLDDLRGPSLVAGYVPALELCGVGPGAIHPRRRGRVAPADDDGVMDDACLAPRFHPFLFSPSRWPASAPSRRPQARRRPLTPSSPSRSRPASSRHHRTRPRFSQVIRREAARTWRCWCT